LTTKIHVLADAQGRPLRFILTGGEAHDLTTAQELLTGIETGGVIADRAYDSNAVRDLIKRLGRKQSSRPNARATSSSRMTSSPIACATASSASSTNSNTSVTSPRATTAAQSTSSLAFTSQAQ
jgi:transposase